MASYVTAEPCLQLLTLVKTPEPLLAQQSGDILGARNNGCPQTDSLANQIFSHSGYCWGSRDSLHPCQSTQGFAMKTATMQPSLLAAPHSFPLTLCRRLYISCSAETSFWHFHALNREHPNQLPHVFLAVLAPSFSFKCENRMPWQNSSTSQAQVCSLPP